MTYAACDMAGEKTTERASMHGDDLAHAGWGRDVSWPRARSRSHTLNLAWNDHLLGYLPVVGPGKSLAVAMVEDSDSSKGRRGEQHRDKKRWPQSSKENTKRFPWFWFTWQCAGMHSLLSHEPNTCLTGLAINVDLESSTRKLYTYRVSA